MTPAEFNEYYDAKVKDRDDQTRRLDTLNALCCLVIAKCARYKNVRFTDFLAFQQREPEKSQTEDEYNQALDLWIIASHNRR